MSLQKGTRLKHYEILGPLGRGGMGEVFRARDAKLGRDVAIKILPRRYRAEKEAMSRFEREAKAIAKLNHPHIVTIHEVGKARLPGERFASHFLVTELIEGQSLRAHVGRTDLKRVLVWLTQVADALTRAHAAGVVHRDLKPDNIMITNDGYAKVLDFGLAKLTGEINVEDATARFETQEGIVVGTLGYMAPEQAQGRDIDERSDIFSFGCILYEVVTGKRAFDADTPIDTLFRVIHSDPPALHEVPPDLRPIVDRCLAKQPQDRYRTIRDVADALRGGRVELPQQQKAKPAKSVRSSTKVKSLAILPFVNVTADPELEYLADGVTESLIHDLAQLRRVKVMARSTVFTYKGRAVTPQEVGRDLNVTSVITGRVNKASEQLLVNLELVNASDGAQIWGARYRKPMSDLFALQEEISTQIFANLKLELSPSERKKLHRRPTKNTAAYELYLKGRYYANKRTADSLARAKECFSEAIALDAKFALAYGGLADAHLISMGKSFVSPEDSHLAVEVPARRALELDPDLAEVHATLGGLNFIHKWRWSESEHELREAIRLNPSYSTAHHWLAAVLTILERHEEAVAAARTAVSLDPLSLLINVHLADTLHYAGLDDEGLRQCQRTKELDPTYFWIYFVEGRCYEGKGDFKAAAASFRTAIEYGGRYPELVSCLAYALGRAGELDEARQLVRELEERSTREFIGPQFLAEAYEGTGDRPRAVAKVREYLSLRSGEPVEVLIGHRFAELRKEPAFDSIVRRVGLANPETAADHIAIAE